MRLDIKLMTDNQFESRTKAQNAIKSGFVYVNGKKVTQCGIEVENQDIITLKGKPLKYVSKGGLKLEKIIKTGHISLKDKVMIDVGASTGGFTDCAIQNGIKKVYTIDIGTNQLHHTLRENPSIICFENTDFRTIDKNLINDADIATVDVSFISSIKMLPKFCELNIKEVLLLIKPQFECGKEFADKYKGVILNRDIHCNVLKKVLHEYKTSGFTCKTLTFSPVKNTGGNIEYIGYFIKSDENYDIDIKNIVENAFKFFIKK